MYETEANKSKESSEQIPADVISQLSGLRGRIIDRTVLPWSEHCTECVWPTCYSSCELYSPRDDGRCRRFVDGMVRIDCAEAFNSYILKIRFKRWGKLWSPGTIRLHSVEEASNIERRDYRIGNVLYKLPAPLKNVATTKRYSLKKRLTYRAVEGKELPTSFMIECYNPGATSVRLGLTMRPVAEKAKIPFQKLIQLDPGFQLVQIDCEEISKSLDLRARFNIELIPDGDFNEVTLYFGLLDFVREIRAPKQPRDQKSNKVKCVVWDLDQTLWDGILVEDGPEKLKLKAGIEEVIKTLDERGILHSVASKNNRDEALAALTKFGLDSYFLAPQISWQPKSAAIDAIARQLNIGSDSLLFIDDSAFEREQVSIAHPEVLVVDAEKYSALPAMSECQVPVTAESRQRRSMYQVEAQRQDTATNFGDDYISFLRDCRIQLYVRPLTADSLDRVHELTTRTNQMNFSGNKYDRNVLKEILRTPYLDTYVLDVEDRFGSYGIVGFSIVDSRVPLMTDLMFSCRIQSKRVEHAFLSFLIRKYISETGKDFWAHYRKTPRNAPSGRVFSDLLLEERESKHGVSQLVFPQNRPVPEDDIIKISVYNQEQIVSS